MMISIIMYILLQNNGDLGLESVMIVTKSVMILMISVTIKILMITTTTIIMLMITSSSGRCEGKFDTE